MYVKLYIYMFVCTSILVEIRLLIIYTSHFVKKLMHASCCYDCLCVCTAVMWSDIVERAERDRLMAISADSYPILALNFNSLVQQRHHLVHSPSTRRL